MSQHRLHLGRLQQLKKRRVHHDKRLPSSDRERVRVGAWVLRASSSLAHGGSTPPPTHHRTGMLRSMLHSADDRHAEGTTSELEPYLADIQVRHRVHAKDVRSVQQKPMQACQLIRSNQDRGADVLKQQDRLRHRPCIAYSMWCLSSQDSLLHMKLQRHWLAFGRQSADHTHQRLCDGFQPGKHAQQARVLLVQWMPAVLTNPGP